MTIISRTDRDGITVIVDWTDGARITVILRDDDTGAVIERRTYTDRAAALARADYLIPSNQDAIK